MRKSLAALLLFPGLALAQTVGPSGPNGYTLNGNEAFPVISGTGDHVSALASDIKNYINQNSPVLAPIATGIPSIDTANLVALLTSGNYVTLPANQIYVVNSMTMPANTTLDCHGSTLFVSGLINNNNILNIGSSSNITVRNCVFDEQNISEIGGPSGLLATGIYASSASAEYNILVEHNSFINIPVIDHNTHAIGFNGHYHATFSHNYVQQSGGDEINVNSGSGFYKVEFNDLENGTDGGVAFNNGARGEIVGNYVFNCNLGVGSGPSNLANLSPPLLSLVITDNVFDSGFYGVSLAYVGVVNGGSTGAPTDWTIGNNVFKDNSSLGIQIYGNPGPNWAAGTVTAASWGSSVVSFTFASGFTLPNQMPIGSSFTIAGMTPSGYNGTYTALTAGNSGTVTAALVSNPGPATGFGTLAVQGPNQLQQIGGTITGNKFYSTGSAVYSGTASANANDISILYSQGIDIVGNNINGNQATSQAIGIYVDFGSNVNIRANQVRSSDGGTYGYGIYMVDNDASDITENQIKASANGIFSTDGGFAFQRREYIHGNHVMDFSARCIQMTNAIVHTAVDSNYCQTGSTSTTAIDISPSTTTSKITNNKVEIGASGTALIFQAGTTGNDVEFLNNETGGIKFTNNFTGTGVVDVFPNFSGTKGTVSGCSATLAATTDKGGKATLGANSCTLVFSPDGGLAMGLVTGYTCVATDLTAPTVAIPQSAQSTTSCSFAVPSGAGTTDVILISAVGGA